MLIEKLDEALESAPEAQNAALKTSRAIHKWVLAGGTPRRRIADMLHGTWLGHPLHPMLTDVTTASWILGAMTEGLGLMTRQRWLRRAGVWLQGIGTASAVPTALSGLTDYSTVPKDAADDVAVHAASNIIAFTLHLISLRQRMQSNHFRAFLFAVLGTGFATIGSWLGGDIVFRKRVGVNRNQPEMGPEVWTGVMAADALIHHQPQVVTVDEQKILLYRYEDEIHAISAVCGHAGGPLEEGTFEGVCVQCPWHDSVFDLRDGGVVHGPATFPQPRYDVRVDEGRIKIRRAISSTASNGR